jgi:tRNA threonylcarbamoyladenosine biosynthesis protein TsaE
MRAGAIYMEFYTKSEQETENLGCALGKSLKPGTVVAYYGDLGAGKTAFTRGLARGLGVHDRVTSPTYTIVNEYSGRIPLFHFDMYRLDSSEELFDIGWEDYLSRGGVLAVEWSERVEDALEDPIVVRLEKDPQEPDHRKITITGGEELADLSL